MSSLVISGDTSGSVTLQAPAVAGTTVLTLPATSGTVITTASGTAATATNLAGGVAGAVPYQSGVGATGFSAAGTSGQPVVSGGAGAPVFRPYTLPATDGSASQVLQTNGAGALSFATPSSGALVFLSTVTASASSTVDIETTFSSTYQNYLIIASGITVSDDNVSFNMRMKIGGTYKTDAFYAGHFDNSTSGFSGYSGAISNASAQLQPFDGMGNAAGKNLNFSMNVYNASSTSLYKHMSMTGSIDKQNGNNAVVFGTGCYNNSTAALTGVRFYTSAGTISGTFRLYGIANS